VENSILRLLCCEMDAHEWCGTGFGIYRTLTSELGLGWAQSRLERPNRESKRIITVKMFNYLLDGLL
jgi:hypothetical protein